ncbi:MAG: S1C family serine protease, partial [Planctomycetota bacterium]
PKGGRGERGFRGIGCAPVHPAGAPHLGLDAGAGVSVGDVWKGSAAEKAGLRPNDVIVSVDGKEVRGPDDFIKRLAKKAPGESVKIEAIQGGARKSFEVALGERPPEAGPARVEPFPRFAWPGVPQPPERPEPPQFGRRGRIILRGPDGEKKLFELPEESWDFNRFFEEMERQFPELWKIGPEDRMRDKIEKLFDTLREGHKGDWSVSSQTAIAVVRILEDDLDITVRDENGVRTVDVKKGEKAIAENLPWEKIDSLPADIRERVEKAGRGIKIDVRGPAPKPIERRAEKEVRA